MNSLSVGIVGAGKIASLRHMPIYEDIDGVRVKSVCDRDSSLADEFGEEYNTETYYDVESMLESEKLDLIDICVPPKAHADVAITGMENGCHILVEKPMAISIEECEKMKESAERNGVKLCTMHNQKFHPPVLEAKKKIDNGDVGNVIGMRTLQVTPREEMIDKENHWYHELPGGIIGETFPHTSYLTLEFLDEIDEIEVNSECKVKRSWAPHDEFRIEMKGPNGMNSATLSYSTNISAAKVDVIGTEGILQLDLLNMRVTEYDLREIEPINLGIHSLKDLWQRFRGLAENAAGIALDGKQIGSEVIIRRFVTAIREDNRPPVTPEEGTRVVELVQKAVNSYDTSR